MLHWAIKLPKHRDSTVVHYKMLMDRNENGHRLRYLDLKAVVGPGDDLEPVLTIMLPWQD